MNESELFTMKNEQHSQAPSSNHFVFYCLLSITNYNLGPWFWGGNHILLFTPMDSGIHCASPTSCNHFYQLKPSLLCMSIWSLIFFKLYPPWNPSKTILHILVNLYSILFRGPHHCPILFVICSICLILLQ